MPRTNRQWVAWLLVWGLAVTMGVSLARLEAEEPAVGHVRRLAHVLEVGRPNELENLAALTPRADQPQLWGFVAEARARVDRDWPRANGEEWVAEATRRAPQPWTDAAWLAHVLTSTAALDGAIPDTPKGRVARALREQQRRGPAAGLEILDAALKTDAGRKGTELERARMQVALGAIPTARDLYAELKTIWSDDPGVWYEAAVLELQSEAPLSAPPSALKDAPEHLRARARVLFAVDASRGAEPPQLGPAPRVSGLERVWGELLLWSGDPDAARVLFQSLEDARVATARARFLQRLARCGAGVGLGEVTTAAGALPIGRFDVRFGEPVPVRFVPNEELFPEHLYAEVDETAYSAANRVALARLCMASDRVDRAARYLEVAAEMNADIVSFALRARALLAAGQPKAAIAVLVERPEHDRSLEEVVLLARALRASGRLEDAIEVLQGREPELVRAPTALRLHTALQVELDRRPDDTLRRWAEVQDDALLRLAQHAFEGGPPPAQAALLPWLNTDAWSDLPERAQVMGAELLMMARIEAGEGTLLRMAQAGSSDALRALGRVLVARGDAGGALELIQQLQPESTEPKNVRELESWLAR